MAATKNTTSVFSNSLTGNVVSASVARATGEGLLCAVWQECDFASVGSAGAPVWDAAGDNQTFTAVASQREWVTTNRKLSLFVLPAPTTAKTGAVESTLTGGYGGATTHERASMLVVRISGHDAADMIRASNARQESAPETNDLPNTVTSAVGDLVVFFGSGREFLSEFDVGDTSGYEEFTTSVSSRSLFVGTKAGAASTTTGTFNYINTTGQSNALIAVSIKAGAAPDPVLTGNISAADATATGSLATLPPSSLTGNITAADAAPTGSLGQQLASLTTLPFTRNPGNGGRVVSIANVALAVLTDDVNLARLAGSTGLLMGVDGRLSLANQVPAPPGSTVVVVTREPDGKLGVERYALT